uniref:Uncharacterized protein n=1 Tax=Chromera velia CCMP2878 TaxID=1169474 RepID=A0A0G4GA66_9ALVE|eukprot:Cvel_20972.t1-p1 / transcript=Cvel_20972.t1 / gene=Cvel_20972 / organism=Chromera_velia_CCMP2878 / gene_product=hypothetical protein / transcript_product=hypothetical protein / location=Cvel_scaffold1928:23432-24364(+) / protein_length=311 / sequence_SO=supercontig / SO=protein_coding / is_pseudo=false
MADAQAGAGEQQDYLLPKKRTTTGKTFTHTAWRVASLTFFPFLVFSIVLILWVFAYHEAPFIVYMSIVALGILALVFLVSGFMHQMQGGGRRPAAGRVHFYMALFIFLACVVGYIVGEHIYTEYMEVYHGYVENQVYNNVVATDAAQYFSDAGKIHFNEAARVDTDKSVGFKQGGTMYCVAPVVQTGSTETNKVEFWAVGLNCCDKKGVFDCDDSHNAKAKGAVVVMGDEFLEKAVKKAEVAFSLVSSSEPVYVRWVNSPDDVVNAQYNQAVGHMLIAMAGYLIMSLLLAIVGNIIIMNQSKSQGGGAEEP